MSEVVIRRAIERDVPALNAIYNGYIVDSHVSFDLEPWSDEKRLDWFRARADDGYPLLVACDDGNVIGASWAGPWRQKKAYRGSVESTVVLAPGTEGRGLGSKLYAELLDALRAEGFHRAYAIIALPNDPSIALHRKLGYREIGVLEEAGFKDGKFHSTMLMELALN
ncbi:MAG: GNAT family N-acetyltransferase [Acidimicrobiia bacterium]|nr:MAG: GNAT family N-acetyltransferase [Acidimicrobiia bacterium]